MFEQFDLLYTEEEKEILRDVAKASENVRSREKANLKNKKKDFDLEI